MRTGSISQLGGVDRPVEEEEVKVDIHLLNLVEIESEIVGRGIQIIVIGTDHVHLTEGEIDVTCLSLIPTLSPVPRRPKAKPSLSVDSPYQTIPTPTPHQPIEERNL